MTAQAVLDSRSLEAQRMQKVRDEKVFKKNAIKEKLKVKYYQDKEIKLKVVLTLTKLLFIDNYFYKNHFFFNIT